MVSISTDPTWELYYGNREDFRREDMESRFEAFGSKKGYSNVCDFLIATDELLGLITDVVRDTSITLNDRCTNLILVLIDIIVNDIVYGDGSGRVHQKLRANGVDEHSAAAFCSPQNTLVKSIQHWVKLYDKLESGTFVAMTSRATRRTYRNVRNTSRQNVGYMVATIVALIAIIPTIAALAYMVNHVPLLETGRPLSSYSGYLTADTGTTFDVDDIKQLDRNKNAMLAYFAVLTDSSPGSYQFGMHGVDGPVSGTTTGTLDHYKATIGTAAGLHRPSDQAMLSIARGSLLEGAKRISIHGNDYYVMTLGEYASQSTMRIVDLFHEHLRVDVSQKIGEYIEIKRTDTGDDQTCQVHSEMLAKLKEFIDKRTDSFATLDSVMLSYMDTTVDIFDRWDYSDAPILAVMKGVNTCNIDKFKQGLSRLFIQYTGYIHSNINSIRDSLITLQDDHYSTRSIAIGSKHLKAEKVGQIKQFLQRNILPSVRYLFAFSIHGEDSPVTEYRKWQLSFYDAPMATVAASLLSGAGVAAGTGAVFGANMFGAGGVAALAATGYRLGASFWN